MVVLSFIGKYILFLSQDHIVSSPFGIIFSGYMLGVLIWTFLAYAFSDGHEERMMAAWWSQGLGYIFFLTLIMGEKGFTELNESYVRLLPMLVYACIALLSYKAFMEEEWNPVGNAVFCIVVSTVYSILLRNSLVVIVFSPVFVLGTSYILRFVDMQKLTAFIALTGMTILLILVYVGLLGLI